MKFESLFAPVICGVVTFTCCFVVIIGLGIGALVSDYSSKLKVPATIYEIGEVVNYDYKVVATDGKNTLWLQCCDDDCTYVAVVSSDYPNLSLSEKIKWMLNTSLKDNVNIEIITEQVENQE